MSKLGMSKPMCKLETGIEPQNIVPWGLCLSSIENMIDETILKISVVVDVLYIYI